MIFIGTELNSVWQNSFLYTKVSFVTAELNTIKFNIVTPNWILRVKITFVRQNWILWHNIKLCDMEGPFWEKIISLDTIEFVKHTQLFCYRIYICHSETHLNVMTQNWLLWDRIEFVQQIIILLKRVEFCDAEHNFLRQNSILLHNIEFLWRRIYFCVIEHTFVVQNQF